jgi:hypothetical protein
MQIGGVFSSSFTITALAFLCGGENGIYLEEWPWPGAFALD